MRASTALLCALVLWGCKATELPEPPQPDPAWTRSEVLEDVREEDVDPARLVPADCIIYARIEDGGGLLADERDPLSEEAWRVIDDAVPGGFWRPAAEAMGMTEREILARLFVRDLVITDQRVDDRRGAVILSRVDRQLLERLPDAANLQPWSEQPEIGPYKIYEGETENGSRFLAAIGERWLAFCSAKFRNHLRKLLTARAAEEDTLVNDPDYGELLSRLPTERAGLMCTRNSDGTERHAVAFVREGEERVDVYYAGLSPQVEKYIAPTYAVEGVDFGPMPNDVVAAATLNLLTQEIPGESAADLALFPGTFRDRVVPKIAPPILVFLARLPASKIDPSPGFDVPVVGLAIKVTDPDVVPALNQIITRLHFFGNVSQLALKEGFFGVDEKKYRDVDYQVADFGPIIRSSSEDTVMSRMVNDPDAKELTKLAFGLVGEHFVVCTQEVYLQKWIDSVADGKTTLAESRSFQDFAFEDRERLVLSAMVRGQEMSSLVNDAAVFLDEKYGDEASRKAKIEEDQAEAERRKIERVEKPLRWASRGFEHSKTFALQVWHDSAQFLRGRLRVVR